MLVSRVTGMKDCVSPDGERRQFQRICVDRFMVDGGMGGNGWWDRTSMGGGGTRLHEGWLKCTI